MYVTDTSYYTNHLDIILNLNDFELHSHFGGKCSEKHLTFMKRLPIPETCDVSCRIVLRPDTETIRSSGYALNETSTPKKLHYLVETKISKWESTHEMFAAVIATSMVSFKEWHHHYGNWTTSCDEFRRIQRVQSVIELWRFQGTLSLICISKNILGFYKNLSLQGQNGRYVLSTHDDQVMLVTVSGMKACLCK